MAQFWNCLFNCLPRGQRTEPSHFLTFCPLFHQLMRSKRVVSEGDLEIGHLSRESYYTSIQSLFSQHFFSFVLPSAIFFAVPLLSSPLPSLVSIRRYRRRCYQSFQLRHLVKLRLKRWGVSWFWYGQLSWRGEKNTSFQQKREQQEGLRSGLLSQSGLSGAREWALQCTPVPLLLLMEQSCRKWGPYCLSPMLSFYT